jgi:hypothetical protein
MFIIDLPCAKEHGNFLFEPCRKWFDFNQDRRENPDHCNTMSVTIDGLVTPYDCERFANDAARPGSIESCRSPQRDIKRRAPPSVPSRRRRV